MNYYIPALAARRNGLPRQLGARLPELVVAGYNTLLAGVYSRYGVRVANVSGAFHTADFSPQVTLPGLGRLPRNVAVERLSYLAQLRIDAQIRKRLRG